MTWTDVVWAESQGCRLRGRNYCLVSCRMTMVVARKWICLRGPIARKLSGRGLWCLGRRSSGESTWLSRGIALHRTCLFRRLTPARCSSRFWITVSALATRYWFPAEGHRPPWLSECYCERPSSTAIHLRSLTGKTWAIEQSVASALLTSALCPGLLPIACLRHSQERLVRSRRDCLLHWLKQYAFLSLCRWPVCED